MLYSHSNNPKHYLKPKLLFFKCLKTHIMYVHVCHADIYNLNDLSQLPLPLSYAAKAMNAGMIIGEQGLDL